jgi:Leucine-rich repeat (LRR) protein
LTGPIPSSLGNLSELEILYLFSNQLTGRIPSSVGGLSQLLFLSLDTNQLTGPIPSSLGDLSKLQALYLYSNQLAGKIPYSLTNLTQLQVLNLDNNKLTGIIPADLGNMSQLQFLTLNSNQLVGKIPSSLGSLTKLEGLGIFENKLTGPIPLSFSNLSLLMDLDMHDNQLTGSIPSFLGNLSNLQTLYLYSNQLIGTIPSRLGNLSQLQELDVHDNQLTGLIPSDLAKLPNLQALYLDVNELSASIPLSFEQFTALQVLVLNFNQLTGQIRTSTCIVQFQIDGNLLSGLLPVKLIEKSMIQELDASNNLLSGSLPSSTEKGQLVNLQLSNNLFSGSLPSGLLREHLQVLYLDGNRFSGSIPTDWFDMSPNLAALVMAGNCLTGTIPVSICASSVIRLVALDGLHGSPHCERRLFSWDSSSGVIVKHGMKGSIPECLFANQPELQIMQLSGNGLTGTIPEITMNNLSRLVLSNNQLDGTLPTNVLSKVVEVDLSFNRITGVLDSMSVDQDTVENRSVTLNVNRLSGHVPAELSALHTVNILQGNLFGCNAAHSNIPAHDPNYESYDCGSDAVNATLYSYCAVLLTIVLGVSIAGLLVQSRIVDTWALTTQWLKWSDECELRDTMIRELRRVSQGSIVALVVSIAVLLPLFVALGQYSSTVTHRYAWLLSAVYLQGLWAAVSMLVVFGVLLGLLMALLSHELVGVPWAEPLSCFRTRDCVINANKVKTLLWTTVGAVLVLLVNIGYVSAVSNGRYSSRVLSLIAFLLSVFKLLWNQLLLWYVQYNAQLPWIMQCDVGLMWLVGAALFNHLLAPYLAEAFVSPNCFLNALSSASDIEVSFPVVACNTITSCGSSQCNASTNCDEMTLQSVSVMSIVPVFEYSFQCSSSLLSAFAQVFLFRFLLSGLVQPVAMAIVRQFVLTLPEESTWRRLLTQYMVQLRWSFVGVADVDQLRKLADRMVSSMVLNLVLDVAIVLTFGMLFPLLAVVGVLSIVKDLYCFRLLLGEWQCSIPNAGGHILSVFVGNLAMNWNKHRVGFYQALAVVVLLSSMLLSWTVFDTYGDVVGTAAAIWVVFVLPVVSVVALLVGQHWWSWRLAEQGINSVSVRADIEFIENPIVVPVDDK